MGKQLDGAEARILATETLATSDEARVRQLEKHTDELMMRLDRVENYKMTECLPPLLGRRYGDRTDG